MHNFPYLTVLGAIPLLGAIVVGFWPAAGRELAKRVAFLFSLATLVLAIVVAVKFRTHSAARFQFVESHSWISSFHIRYELGVDGVALTLILLATVLFPVVILSSWRDADAEQPANGAAAVAEDANAARRARSPQLFFALVLLLETLLVGVFSATDVFLFYVFFEVMLIPMYFLIGVFGGPQRSYAAVKFLLYSLLGGLFMLAAVIGLYVVSGRAIHGGSFDFTALTQAIASGQLHMAGTVSKALFLGFFVAFAVKAPLFPFHTWLPDAAAEATPGTAVLLSALDTVGVFGMLRYCLELFPSAAKYFAPVVIVLAVIAALYGALLAIGQTDIKRLIAYTSISHFGLIILGVFAMTSQGQSGAALYLVNYGLSTGAMFIIAGYMISRRGSRLIGDYGGVQKVAPLLAGTFLVAGLSSLSLPGMGSFISEFLVLVGTFERYRVAAVIGTAAIVLAAIYILWLYQRTMTGPVATGNEHVTDLRARELIAVVPLLGLLIFLGVYPKPVLDMINPSVDQTLTQVQRHDPAPSVAAPVIYTGTYAPLGQSGSGGNGK
jgi:NADH-quinone oxidoreductase subunit M